jgi:hypothetical protein
MRADWGGGTVGNIVEETVEPLLFDCITEPVDRVGETDDWRIDGAKVDSSDEAEGVATTLKGPE